MAALKPLRAPPALIPFPAPELTLIRAVLVLPLAHVRTLLKPSSRDGCRLVAELTRRGRGHGVQDVGRGVPALVAHLRLQLHLPALVLTRDGVRVARGAVQPRPQVARVRGGHVLGRDVRGVHGSMVGAERAPGRGEDGRLRLEAA